MAEIKGRDHRIYVVAGAAGTPDTIVGGAFDADFAREPQQATHNSYDTGAFVERKVIRYDGDLTFKFYTDPSDSGQGILRAAIGSTPAQITVDYAEGVNTPASGNKYQRFTANVRVKRGAPVDGMAVTEVTLSPDGAVTEGTY
jgi:hypothetical protein